LTQTICIILTGGGIAVEFIFHADLGFMAITIGSLLFSVTTKVENYYLTKKKGKRYGHKSF
jgi:hypothetical protein